MQSNNAEVLSYDNFIMLFEDFFTLKECKETIAWYQLYEDAGMTQNRFHGEGTIKNRKDDEYLHLSDIIKGISKGIVENASDEDVKQNKPLKYEIDAGKAFGTSGIFNDRFWNKVWPVYEQKYSTLTDHNRIVIKHMKFQKTEIGSGYHVWHEEYSGHKDADVRVLTWILYLNDVDEGGETEFLYYPGRIKPKAGSLVLFPAYFTHVHRGNPPISNTKYIITGWCEYE